MQRACLDQQLVALSKIKGSQAGDPQVERDVGHLFAIDPVDRRDDGGGVIRRQRRAVLIILSLVPQSCARSRRLAVSRSYMSRCTLFAATACESHHISANFLLRSTQLHWR